MLRVSRNTLVVLAALTWVTGGVALLLKGSDLWGEAAGMRPGNAWLWLAVAGGAVFGSLKVYYIFNPACRRNLDRIAGLDQPMLWQFFRARFFFFLALMIAAGAAASHAARGSFPFLVAVATIDFSLAVALLGSSVNFLRRRSAFIDEHL